MTLRLAAMLEPHDCLEDRSLLAWIGYYDQRDSETGWSESGSAYRCTVCGERWTSVELAAVEAMAAA